MWATLLQAQTPACSWCRLASTRHPDVRLQVLSYYARAGGSALELVQMTGSGWPRVVEEIRGVETVNAVKVVESNERAAKVQVDARSCPLPEAIDAAGVVPQTPFDVADGCDRWLLLGEREELAAFAQTLREQGVTTTVLRSGPYEPRAALTPRQREVLAAALAHGYYQRPRRITLAGLAGKLGVAKSTLSQSLATIEGDAMRQLDPLARTRVDPAPPRKP